MSNRYYQVEVDFFADANAEARDISYKSRKEMKDSDFLDSENRSFPVTTCQDVMAAVHAWGRYKGPMSFETFKKKLTARAHKLGCKLPASWTEDKK